MKSVFLVIALCLGLTAPVAADDWELLSKNETAIRFNAPRLDGVPTKFLTNSSGGKRTESGIWSDGGGLFPQAIVRYFILDAHNTFKEDFDLEAVTEASPHFKDRAVNWGDEGGTHNAQGKIAYEMFELELSGYQCGAFVQYWGDTGDIEGNHNQAFLGYYCSDPGRPLSSEEFVTALKGLKVVVPGKWSEGTPVYEETITLPETRDDVALKIVKMCKKRGEWIQLSFVGRDALLKCGSFSEFRVVEKGDSVIVTGHGPMVQEMFEGLK